MRRIRSPRRFHPTLWLLGLLSLAPAIPAGAAAADDFSGTFSTAAGDATRLVVELKPADGGAYAGTIRLGDKSFPLTARPDPADASRLVGAFESGGQKYDFAATLAGGQLRITTGRSAYTLRPVNNAPANPLDPAPGAAPPEKPAGPGEKPAAPAPPAPAPATAPAAILVLRPQRIFDDTMNMDAATILLPEGWRFNSRVYWVAGSDGLAKLDVAVYNPTSRGLARVYPRLVFVDGVREAAIRADQAQTGGALRQTWEANLADGRRSNGGVGAEIRRQPATPRQFLQQFVVPRLRPDLTRVGELKVVSEKDLPEYAKAAASAAGNGSTARSARVRLSYTSKAEDAGSAEPVEEEFVCTVVSTPIGVGPNATTLWAGDAESYRAPAGRLDAAMPALAVVRSSLRVELPWFNLVQQIGQMLVNAEKEKLQRMIQDTRERMDALHAYARQAGAEVSQRVRDNFERQQKAKADQQDRFLDYVNDVQGYRDPATGSTLKLPGGYQFGYVSSGGGVILTNSAAYQPPADPKTSWQRLEPVK